MSNSKVPFYAQVAILDRYIHSSNPTADVDTLDIILEMLRSRRDLRDYFFRSGPNAAWAPILWERGFFETPPSPQKAEVGYVLPRWDVQEYLISVADRVPDIVIEHVKSIQGDAWYISRAILALCNIPAEEVGPVVPRLVEWLDDPQIATRIASETIELVARLAKAGQAESTIRLFRALTAPVLPPDAKDSSGSILGAEAVSRFRNTWNEEQVLLEGLQNVTALDVQQVVAILEEHLCTALRLEAGARNSPDHEFSSLWRTAIEDTDQDSNRTYKQRLVRALRDTLETWVQQDAAAVRSLVQRYLGDQHEILHRLGLHILRRFPMEYREYVVAELRRRENLDDVGIHHEFFMLMQEGYPHLETTDQETLVSALCGGPPAESVAELAEWAQKERGDDPGEYAEGYSKKWIRDRLWMLKDYLTGQPAQRLKELVDELGTPEHPAFTRWSTGFYAVRDVSPITDREISQMSPDELVSYLEQWQPIPDRRFGPERISYKGLANVVAGDVIANPQKYADHLEVIALHCPEFAYAILERFTGEAKTGSARWELAIKFCEELLVDDTVREDMGRSLDGSWGGVRQSIVRLMELGLGHSEHLVPAGYLPRMRDILLCLIDDPDTGPTSDLSSLDWATASDPATDALNHVRPRALLTLIEYARYRAQLDGKAAEDGLPDGPGPERLEVIVREGLTRRLDRQEDPGRAVHSVYGRRLLLLHWLDKGWVESHIDQILPEEDDEQSTWFYVAAWDSFVVFNPAYSPMLEMLRPKYERAIHNLSKGYVTKTHLQPEYHLAAHLISEYLRNGYDLQSPSGQESLIARFFKQAPPEARGEAARALWQICAENPSDLETFWSKVRSLWTWRTQESSAANHSTDFDEEMQWYARLPLKAPAEETIASLWPLLEGLLPHITRSEHRGMGWESVEEYLSREVDRDPVRTVQFYHLMHSLGARPSWSYRREEVRRIIETAAACQDSRQETLSLIDLLARSRGCDLFRDIYERYAG
jgi:hypothetical protein